MSFSKLNNQIKNKYFFSINKKTKEAKKFSTYTIVKRSQLKFKISMEYFF